MPHAMQELQGFCLSLDSAHLKRNNSAYLKIGCVLLFEYLINCLGAGAIVSLWKSHRLEFP